MQVSVEVSVCVVVKKKPKDMDFDNSESKRPIPFECRKREVMLKDQFAFYYLKLYIDSNQEHSITSSGSMLLLRLL